MQTAKGLKDPRENKQNIGPNSRELGQEQVRSAKQESHDWMSKENEGEQSSPACPCSLPPESKVMLGDWFTHNLKLPGACVRKENMPALTKCSSVPRAATLTGCNCKI